MSTDSSSIQRHLIDVPAGLSDVVVAETSVGDVDGRAGYYHYRGYNAIHLARQCTFEEVVHLMLTGHLPTSEELRDFTRRMGRARAVPDTLWNLLPHIATDDPLVTLRTALSALGGVTRAEPLYDVSETDRLSEAVSIVAVIPTIVAAAFRIRLGLAPIRPDASVSHAFDYLRMVTGNAPLEKDVAAIEKYLIATIDHGVNASTFTTRVVASTGADMPACIVGGIGAFSGPLHGGAPARALAAMDDIGEPSNTRQWVRTRVASGERIMGFGHAVYRTTDPRSELLKTVAQEYDSSIVSFAIEIERQVVDALTEIKPDRKLYANVEFYAGIVMTLTGIDRTMFTPTFCVARVVGWSANVLEQATQHKIFRPSSRYVGRAVSD